MSRLLSLALFLAVWAIAARELGGRLLPDPLSVMAALRGEAQSGALAENIGATLARVAAGFSLAMILGGALGLALGRLRWLDRLVDPWLVILLNLPALVVIILCYVWGGLNEGAALAAVALNKLPSVAVTLREGARALDPALDEMASLFQFSRLKRLRHVHAPQLAPFVAASARSGLALAWKIVLVVELLGRPNGVGFKLNEAFQLFDLKLLFAYALPFVGLMLLIESFVLRPFERAAGWWRRHGA